jgi:hypothetical protein
MAHDAGIAEQAGDVALAEAGDQLRVEVGEGLAEGLALVEDRQPAEAGLEALEAELLEQAPVVADRESPIRCRDRRGRPGWQRTRSSAAGRPRR